MMRIMDGILTNLQGNSDFGFEMAKNL